MAKKRWGPDGDVGNWMDGAESVGCVVEVEHRGACNCNREWHLRWMRLTPNTWLPAHMLIFIDAYKYKYNENTHKKTNTQIHTCSSSSMLAALHRDKSV